MPTKAVELVQGEPVGWVTADTVDGQTVNGKPRRIWWENNEGVGIPIYTAPQPSTDVSALVEASRAALAEIENILQEAYNSAYPVCCGRSGQECCGSPEPEWSEADQRTMDRLGHHQRALNSALATYRKQGGVK